MPDLGRRQGAALAGATPERQPSGFVRVVRDRFLAANREKKAALVARTE